MATLALQAAVATLLLLISVAIYARQRFHSYYAHLPPGPPSSFLGTAIPQLYPWRTFEQWTHQYGPIITVWLGFKPLIVVGSYGAAMELLEKSSGVTSDRPSSIMASDTMSGGKRILLVGHGERWRRLRKMLHQGLQPKMAASFEPIQEQAALTMIHDNLVNPDAFADNAKKYAASVILRVTYGKEEPTEYSDPEVVEVNRCGARLGAAMRPGAYLVDSFSFLKHLPGKWKAYGKMHHREELALFAGQLDKVRQQLAAGKASLGFGTFMVNHQEEYGLSNDEAAYLGGSMFGAGSDTTASALAIAIMAATLNPRVVAAAQAELDEVIGRERTPNFDDQSTLPYLSAFIREVFRWRPVSSGGFQHSTTAPLTYNGYLIPSGTAIVGNHWSISRDPEVFPEPEEFKPERWFVDGKKEMGLRKDVNHVGYGFGRRICAGKNVADRSLFINCALLLWSFNFGKKRDSQGNEIDIDTLAFTNHANSHPLPFAASLTPRFAGVETIIEDARSAVVV